MSYIRNNLLPTFTKTRRSELISTFGDMDYYITPAASIRVNNADYGAGGAASCRTGLETMFRSALYMASKHDKAKDWDATQVSYAVEKAVTAYDLLQNLSLQRLKRTLLPMFTQNDATHYWSEESWLTFIQVMNNTPIRIPTISIIMAAALAAYTRHSLPYVPESIPPGYFVPFESWMTLAEAEDCLESLKGAITEGDIHYAKASIPTIALNYGVIPYPRMYDPFSNEGLYWEWVPEISQYTGAAWSDIVQVGSPAAGSYTSIPIRWDGDKYAGPSNMWSLVPLTTPYHAVNAPYGAMVLNAKPGAPAQYNTTWEKSQFAGTAMGIADQGECAPFCLALARSYTYDGQAIARRALNAYANPDLYMPAAGISQDAYEQIFGSALIRAWLTVPFYLDTTMNVRGDRNARTRNSSQNRRRNSTSAEGIRHTQRSSKGQPGRKPTGNSNRRSSNVNRNKGTRKPESKKVIHK